MSIFDKAARAFALRWLRGKADKARKEGSKTMRFLDGWKTAITAAVWVSAAVYALASGHDLRPIAEGLAKAIGWQTPTGEAVAFYGLLANTFVAIWGLVSKALKAWKQYKAGATPAELLSSAGYVKAALADGTLKIADKGAALRG